MKVVRRGHSRDNMPWDAGALGLPGLAVGAALPIPNQAVVLPYPPLQVVATGFTTCALVRSDLENVYCWGLLFDVCGGHRAVRGSMVFISAACSMVGD
jgi:hypothetical protein